MPDLVIVSGPNGAGKTTFANEYLQLDRDRFVYLNADEIAQELALSGVAEESRDWRSGREMLKRLNEAIDARLDVMLETTLANLSYANRIPSWRGLGYHVTLIYLRLADVEAAVARVRRRIARGGHGIPEATIRARFAKSSRYLETLYKPIVDQWYVYDSMEGAFNLRQARQNVEG